MFAMFKMRLDALAGHAGCMPAFISDKEINAGDPEFPPYHWLRQGCSVEEISIHRVNGTCPTERNTSGVVLSRTFKKRSPSAGWMMLLEWYMPKSLGKQERWNDKFNDFQFNKNETAMTVFALWMELF